ncbi:MAG: hypothetical protein K8H87_05340, partial [Pseudorhodoplanes sp.]|nr:hypothetical protein [Pseudorhodoplanes sp.]
PHARQDIRYRGVLSCYFGFLAVTLAVYSATFLFTYARADDTFLIRTYRHFLYFDLIQGRPLMWYAVDITGWLYQKIGISALNVMRIFGCLVLPLWGLGVFSFVRLFERRPVAVAAAAICLTLPGVSIVVGNGVWILPALICATWGALLLVRGVNLPAAPGIDRRQTAAGLLLIFLSLAYYQAFSLVALSMLAVLVLYATRLDRQFLLRIALTATLLFAAMLVYYVLWFALAFAYHAGASDGYLPWSVLASVTQNIGAFFNERLARLSLLWFVFLDDGRIALVLAAIAILVVDGLNGRMMVGFARILVLFALLGASDAFLFVTNGRVYLRYTTAIAPSLIILALYWHAIRSVGALASRAVSSARPSHPTGHTWRNSLSALCVVACCIALGAYTTVRYIVLPSWLEWRYTLNAVSKNSRIHGPPREIHIRIRPLHEAFLESPPWEYHFFNSSFHGYAWYLTRLALLETGHDERVAMKVFSEGGGSQDYRLELFGLDPSTVNPTRQIWTIDFTALDLKR